MYFQLMHTFYQICIFISYRNNNYQKLNTKQLKIFCAIRISHKLKWTPYNNWIWHIWYTQIIYIKIYVEYRNLANIFNSNFFSAVVECVNYIVVSVELRIIHKSHAKLELFKKIQTVSEFKTRFQNFILNII